jgi:hypothetical protein
VFIESFSRLIFASTSRLLEHDRRMRLQEELDADIEDEGSSALPIRAYFSHSARALLDLRRVQSMHPVLYTLVLGSVFIAVVRTSEIALLGLFVYLAVFAREHRTFKYSGFFYEVFYQVAFVLAVSAVGLGAISGISTSDKRLQSFGLLLLILASAAFIATAIASTIQQDRVTLKAHLAAKWIHMSIVWGLVFILTLGHNTFGFAETILVGTFGWVIILVLGNQKPKVPSTQRWE